LEPGTKFKCPPCMAVSNGQPRLKIATRRPKSYCKRPDCELPASVEGEYYIQKLVGRMSLGDQSDGEANFWWLIKWDGYPMGNCTWQPEADIPKPEDLVSKFEVAAQAEGLNLATRKAVLLKEAVDHGWGRGLPI